MPSMDFENSGMICQVNMGTSLHLIDGLIILSSLVIIFAVGYFFSKHQKTASTFFIADGKVPSWAIGMSLLATIVSSITFLAYPGAGFSGNWILLVQGFVVVLTLLVVIWVIVPLYRNVISISAYEYFERRFGYLARLYCSSAFILAYLSKMGTIFYLMGVALSSLIGLETLVVIWTLGFLVVALTLVGGIEAIIWLDVIQGFLLITSGVVVLIVLIFSVDGGIKTILEIANAHDRSGFGPYDWNFAKLTFWVMAINGFFFAIQNFGTNQLVVQRFITAKSNSEAIKASLLGILLSVPLWTLFMFIGTALFAFYYTGSSTFLEEGINPDAVFPVFIMSELPVGIVGLVISGLIAAAFSSLDSELNSVSAVVTVDFYARFRKNISDRAKLVFGRLMVVVAGMIALLIATVYTWVGDQGALGIVITLYAIFSGGIAGMFLLGLLSKKANRKGLYVGIVTCILFTGYAILTSTSWNGELLLDLGGWNFPHHKYMLGVYSHVIVFVIGYIASLFFSEPLAEDSLTFYGWTKKRPSSHMKETVPL